MNHTTTAGIDLDKLEALLNATTPGEWKNDRGYLNGPPLSYDETYFMNDADAEFIAAAKPGMRALIDLARRAEPSVAAGEAANHEAALALFEKQAADFARQFGSTDTVAGMLYFKDPDHQETYSGLLERADAHRAALASPAVSQKAAPEAPEIVGYYQKGVFGNVYAHKSFGPTWLPAYAAPSPVTQQAVSQKDGAAVECGKCNDSGIVGFPPDQYEDCPDCRKAREATTASASTADKDAHIALLQNCIDHLHVLLEETRAYARATAPSREKDA